MYIKLNAFNRLTEIPSLQLTNDKLPIKPVGAGSQISSLINNDLNKPAPTDK